MRRGSTWPDCPPAQQHELTRVNDAGLTALREYLAADQRSDQVVAFLGAGVSVPLYPLWDALIRELVDAAAGRLGEQEAATCRALAHDSPEEAVEIVRERLGVPGYREVLREVLRARTDPESGRSWTPVQELVCRCAFKAVVTTNYDPGIVSARMRVRPMALATGFTTWEDELGLDEWRSGDVFGEAELPVLFAHGQHNRPDSVVLATTEYRRAYAGKLPHVLGSMVAGGHLAWIGFSFADQRIAAILREIAATSGTRVDPGAPPRHIAVMAWDPAATGNDPQTLARRAEIGFGAKVVLYPAPGRDHSALAVLLSSLADPRFPPAPDLPARTKATATPVSGPAIGATSALRWLTRPAACQRSRWLTGPPGPARRRRGARRHRPQVRFRLQPASCRPAAPASPGGPGTEVAAATPGTPGATPELAGDRMPMRWVPGAERVEHFTGRAEELARLDRWAADPQVALVGVTAWGGAGKTSLVTRWVQEGGRCRRPGLAGGFGWSFYADPSAEHWAGALLEWAQRELGIRVAGRGRLADAVLAVLRAVPLLLVLDGLEVMQEGPAADEFGRLLDGTLREVLSGACQQRSGRAGAADQPVPVRGSGGVRREQQRGCWRCRRLPRPRGRRCWPRPGGTGCPAASGAAWCRRWTGTRWRWGCWPGCWPTARPRLTWPCCAASWRRRRGPAPGSAGCCGSTRPGWRSRTGTCWPRCRCSPGRSRPRRSWRWPPMTRSAARLAGWTPAMVQAAVQDRLGGLASWHPDGTISAHPLVRETFRPLVLDAAGAAAEAALTGLPEGTVASRADGLRVVEAIELLLDAGQWQPADSMYAGRPER